ncbi:hypothetical protein [Halosimplex amylolyticum]|uniref:hypothetical protein n=1 Tax=Halosimplex amylolyticum TaxID=3396616 RepID=UPI003F5629ED
MISAACRAQDVGAFGFTGFVTLQSGQGGLRSNPWFYAGFSALSLVVGSGVGIWFAPERRWQAGLLAVGGGSLVVSLAFELSVNPQRTTMDYGPRGPLMRN